MEDLQQHLEKCFHPDIYKLILSDPSPRDNPDKKIVISKLGTTYQAERFRNNQVFHENLTYSTAHALVCQSMATCYRQLNAWDQSYTYNLRITKSGKPLYKRTLYTNAPQPRQTHNRVKRYLIEEGTVVPLLVDMGIFTAEGKVVRTMQDKFRQINRFVELFDDELGHALNQPLNIIDFGCGKSYLTFILYHYLVHVRGLQVNMTGLDLKADVVQFCNDTAEKYGYTNLHFALGDINGYSAPGPVDAVITLHACDTATDYALYNAMAWNTKLILSVPCCQHELAGQMCSDNLSILNRYGIIKERCGALMTDAIRANLLSCCGYTAQLLEFVDLSHTPKNLLIRARRAEVSKTAKDKAIAEVEALIKEFQLSPTLYRLLKEGGQIQ